MGKLTVGQIVEELENWAPKSLAYEWDNVGIQMGSLQAEVKGILTTLDVTEAVIDEAIEKGLNMIVSHHPILFVPLRNIDLSTHMGRIIEKVIKHDINIYAMHTNLDVAKMGVSDVLAEKLGLKHIEVLAVEGSIRKIKCQIFVPEDHLEKLQEAFSESKIGDIGDYKNCSFTSKGKGRFTPKEDTSPHIGAVNESTVADEIKVEYLLNEDQVEQAKKLIYENHPYEEPVFDFIPLLNGEGLGVGRIGELPEAISLKSFVNHVKKAYQLNHIRLIEGKMDKVKRIAVLGGSGEKYIQDAIRQKADVYITGDLTYHHAQEAQFSGLTIIDAGHYIEQSIKGPIKVFLEHTFMKGMDTITIVESEVNTNPFEFV